MREEALAYALHGWRVFPVLVGAKAPAVERGVKAATTDPDIVEGWWAERDYNIGVATGLASGIVVVDIDRPEAVGELLDEGFEFPETATVRTPKGLHLYFQVPQEGLRNSAGKLAPGIDVRGDGGYVLAPPSVNGDGAAYHWVDKRRPAELPDWALERLTSRPRPEGEPAPFDAGRLVTAARS